MRFVAVASVMAALMASLSAPVDALASGSGQESLGGSDAFELAVLTTVAVGGAAVLLCVLYLVRLKIGFWLHRPPPRQEGDTQAHH